MWTIHKYSDTSIYDKYYYTIKIKSVEFALRTFIDFKSTNVFKERSLYVYIHTAYMYIYTHK